MKSDSNLHGEIGLYRQCIEQVNEGIWVIDKNSNTTFVNSRMSEMLGYTIDEMLGKPLFFFMSRDVVPVAEKLVCRRKRGIKETHDFEFVRKDGRPIWTSLGASPLFDENGDYAGAIAGVQDITERKRVEEALTASEKRFLNLVEHSFDGITIIGDNGQVAYESPNLTRILGYQPGEKIGTGIFESVHPDDLRHTQEAFLQAVRHPDQIFRLDLRIRHKNGTWRWIECVGRKMAANADIGGILINYRDITDRKQAEESLRESEKKFKSIIDTIQEWIWAIDTKSRHTYCNPAVEKILGYSPAEFAGINAFDFMHPEDAANVRKAFPDFVAKKKGWTGLVVRWRHKDGSYRFLESNSTPIFNDEGNLVGFWGADRDITERKNVEESLKESEERFAQSAEQSRTVTWEVDADGLYTFVSPVVQKVFGYQPEEIIGKKHFYELHPEKGRDSFRVTSFETFRQKEPFKALENPVQAKDGTIIWVLTSGIPLLNSDGTLRGYRGNDTDITAQKLMEEELHTAQKLESLGLLAGGIAHDFNNLMGGIFGYIDLALASSKDSTITNYLSSAMSAIDRARNLTGQLLTFAKGGAPVREIGDLSPVIREASKFALSGSNVSYIFDIADNLWLCNFDKNQISQVIDNIVINAQQAMPMGGTVNISAANTSLVSGEKGALKAGNYVRISIHDEGVGIPEDIITRIFDPFFTTKQKGSGLGLSICHSIIKRHDGWIDVESIYRKGTTFNIYLPASNELLAKMPPAETVSIHRGSGRVLIMDDEEIIRHSAGKLFNMLGYTVECRREGKETLSFINEEIRAGRSFSAILLDLTIPGGMGGKEVAVEIQKMNLKTPVFVASGYSNDPVMGHPNEYGFTDSICKPFTIHELSVLFNRHLQQAQ